MRFKAFHILQFHSFCIEAEQSYFLRDICAHFEKEQLCQPLVTLFDLRTLFVPWGQSRWKSVQSLEHLIKKAHEDPYLQQIQQMFGPYNLSVFFMLFAAACSLAHPSGHEKGLIFLLYAPLIHGLKYA